ncbi:cysteine/serine-rich nuclear protein 1-like [Elysia marginata]|uniref:Cysteine/serine-rich nuclear protein 1-like n=1 Tax=Elysia marginata TaxID=1093978 RepID=A0AAV4HWI3_9GAST|nr:cysteine/serine-rich nuclear protein 1-like [Elysia marginata]
MDIRDFLSYGLRPPERAPVTSSLVKNSSGDGGGYTICMNPRGHNSNSRSPERPGSLPTGRDVTRSARGQGRTETPPASKRSVNRTRREGGGVNSPAGNIPDASPTALLSPASSSVDGNINPSFSSGTISASNTSPVLEDVTKTSASDPCVASPAETDIGVTGPRNTRQNSLHSPHARGGLVRNPPVGKTRAGVYQPVSTQEDDAPTADPQNSDGSPPTHCANITFSLKEGQDGGVGGGPLRPFAQCASSSGNPSLDNRAGSETNLTLENASGVSDISDQNDGADDINAGDLGVLRDQSCFGLTQSDTSVCSAANQGREFSGQREYCPDDTEDHGDDFPAVLLKDGCDEESSNDLVSPNETDNSLAGEPQICITEAPEASNTEEASNCGNTQLHQSEPDSTATIDSDTSKLVSNSEFSQGIRDASSVNQPTDPNKIVPEASSNCEPSVQQHNHSMPDTGGSYVENTPDQGPLALANVDTPNTEPTNVTTPNADSKNVDIPNADSKNVDIPNSDSKNADTPKTDFANTDIPNTNSIDVDTPNNDSTNVNTPNSDSTNVDIIHANDSSPGKENQAYLDPVAELDESIGISPQTSSQKQNPVSCAAENNNTNEKSVYSARNGARKQALDSRNLPTKHSKQALDSRNLHAKHGKVNGTDGDL